VNEKEKLLETLAQQEEELWFGTFTNEDALTLGMLLITRAKEAGHAVTIDITRGGQQLFHLALEGTGPDNDQWIIRKNRVVYRFHKSSFRVGRILDAAGMTLEEKYYVDSTQFSAHGGAFPVRVKGVGVVGTVTVSGLAQEDDHEFVVATLRNFLGSRAS